MTSQISSTEMAAFGRLWTLSVLNNHPILHRIPKTVLIVYKPHLRLILS